MNKKVLLPDACGANPLVLYIPSHRAIALASMKEPISESVPSHPVVRAKYWLLKHEGFLSI